mmetsp:Transcript_86443/g.270468  ORF Transcript_86443/g.270468 Transcript_86443/m.270468 type:complete len:136 (+) Transcript_86443:88-495(+)
MKSAVFALLFASVLLVAAWADGDAAKSCQAAQEPKADGDRGASMMQIVRQVGRAVPEVLAHDTHLDPYNVSEGDFNKTRYAEDWRKEWKPDPNPKNRTTTNETEMPTPSPRSSAPCSHGAGIMAAVIPMLVFFNV